MMEKTFAEVFPPGEFLKEELESRGWSQIEFAEILGKTPALVNELVMARRAVTPETAKALARAFGTSAQYWLNLESAYQLWKTKDADESISRRANLYRFAPIKEMVKRNWVEGSENIDVLESQVLKFFKINSLDESELELAHAARKSTPYHEVTPSQRAWLSRARSLGKAVITKPLSKRSLDEGFGSLRSMLHSIAEIRKVPRVLADMGVRLVVVEALPQTRIDGACLWLDKASPVVALSLRYDRVDAFWFTLLHELNHVASGDGVRSTVLDIDLVKDSPTGMQQNQPSEHKANVFASEFLIPKSEIEDFIGRTAPLFSRTKIVRFANRIKVHPGIVVGQLQYRGQLPYSQHRRLLEKVRHVIMPSALTDGWGYIAPAVL